MLTKGNHFVQIDDKVELKKGQKDKSTNDKNILQKDERVEVKKSNKKCSTKGKKCHVD